MRLEVPRGQHPAAPGFVVIDKPAGCTSHDVVSAVRRLACTRKVGHAGTLDPDATGALVVAVGAGTKLLRYRTGADKQYLARVRFGISTTTEDASGEVTQALGARLSAEQIENAASRLRGNIMQVPSAVSAIKVQGKRSYELVREGKEVALEARPVTIDELELTSEPQQVRAQVPVTDISIRVTCSSGTYIRALARDLGEALGCGAHLTYLRRTRVGGFTLDQAVQLSDALVDGELPTISLSEVAAWFFRTMVLSPQHVEDVRCGRRLHVAEGAEGTWAMLDGTNKLVGMATLSAQGDGWRLQPKTVIPQEGSNG